MTSGGLDYSNTMKLSQTNIVLYTRYPIVPFLLLKGSSLFLVCVFLIELVIDGRWEGI